ncbi:hypothetical protein Tco_1544192, partial [Tanacetum coccineum]
TKDKDKGIMGPAVAGLAMLRRCWPHRSSVRLDISDKSWHQLEVVVVAAEVPVQVSE